jgi:hypothetical protein
MDTKLVEDVIRKAIERGATQARPNPQTGPRPEIDAARAQVDVEIDLKVLEDCATDLKRDEEMARLDSAFATTLNGGGAGTGLQMIARRLLARAIVSGDVSKTVETFRFHVRKNTAPMEAVMAVSGVKTAGEVLLGPDIRLVPTTSLSPSLQRAEALGQPPVPQLVGFRQTIASALIAPIEFGPIFYWPSDGGLDRTFYERMTSTRRYLDEARMLLTLLGINATKRILWLQPKDPLMGFGADANWETSRVGYWGGEDVEIDARAANELAEAYFKIAPARRQETLHVPLDRLDRAVRGYDLVDKSIDLGIALEALLLHELEGQYQGELKFRLCLRGAWLGGTHATERAAIQRTLGKVYDLRSIAVHKGKIDRSDAIVTVDLGTALCKQLIRQMIEASGSISSDDWKTRLLGGEAEKRSS